MPKTKMCIPSTQPPKRQNPSLKPNSNF